MLAGGLGVLTRNVALALTTLLLWRFVASGSCRSSRGNRNSRTGHRVARPEPCCSQFTKATGPLAGGMLLLGYVTMVTAATLWTSRYRDPT